MATNHHHHHPDAVLAAVAASQSAAFTREQAREAGLTRQMLRSRRASGLVEVRSRDVFVFTSAPRTLSQDLWIGLLEMDGGAASHRSAASLHGVPGFDGDHVDITQVKGTGRRLSSGSLHETGSLPATHLTHLDGMPVTTLPRTIFDLAGWSSPRRLLHGLPVVPLGRVARALDNAVRLRGMELDELDRVLEDLARRGRPGTQVTRLLLSERGDGWHGTESVLEDLLVTVLRRHDLELPEPQVVLGDDLPIGRVDFLYRSARVVIEADSRKYHLRMLTHDDDIRRDQRLLAAGYVPVRVTWRQLVEEPEGFVRDLRTLLQRRAA